MADVTKEDDCGKEDDPWKDGAKLDEEPTGWGKNDDPWDCNDEPEEEEGSGNEEDPWEEGAKLDEEPNEDVWKKVDDPLEDSSFSASRAEGWQEETKGTQKISKYFIVTVEMILE